jgi:hypothetical protein
MQYIKDLTKEDAIFYLDMINSVFGPNHIAKRGMRSPFYQILSDKNSDYYKRFIRVYKLMRHFLQTREQDILDNTYGVNGEILSLNQMATLFNLSPERIRQLRVKAQRKITMILVKEFNIRKHNKTKFIFP